MSDNSLREYWSDMDIDQREKVMYSASATDSQAEYFADLSFDECLAFPGFKEALDKAFFEELDR